MNTRDLKRLKLELLRSLGCRLTAFDFKAKVSNASFVRRRGEVADVFQLVFQNKDGGWAVQPNVGVRFDRVEEIFHRTSGFEARYQADTVTIGSAIGILLAEDARACEFRLSSEGEIPSVVDGIAAVFEKFALP